VLRDFKTNEVKNQKDFLQVINSQLAVPQFVLNMLRAVDYSKITDAHYDEWLKIIKENIGKHLKLKAKACNFVVLDFPLRQDFCDEINKYDFSSLSIQKRLTVIPLATKWAVD